ncbi:MAG: hypothetical protein LKI25_07725 [Atopobiaceae bacterium]|jgi:hypothetical protein|nr:hypothetical protein [Atopobiaceae bacterium]
MRFYPVRVTKTQNYTIYVEADDVDDALEVAATRLEKAIDLIDQDTEDDYTVHASVEEDVDRDDVSTMEEALAKSVTYVVDHDGKDLS